MAIINGLQRGLVAYWKLDGNSNDTFNLNNGIDTAVIYSSGTINQGAYFNGTSSKIQVATGSTSPFRQVSAITYSYWVKVPAGGFGVMGVATAAGQGSGGIKVGAGGLTFTWTPTNPASDRSYDSFYTVPADTWAHVVQSINFSGISTAQFYINGVAVTTTISNLSIINATPDPSYNLNVGDCIGARSVNGFIPNFLGGYGNASFDEVGIWNRALNAGEALELYNNGRGLSYPFYETSKILSIGDQDSVINPFSRKLANFWKLDGNANDSWNTNDGTETSVTYTSGKINQAASFNGTTSVINVSSFNLPASASSISFWFNASSYTSVFFGSNSNTGNEYIYLSSSSEIWVQTNVSATFKVFTFSDIPLGTWHHLIVTRDSNITRVYLNGLESSSGGQTQTDLLTLNQIGKYSNGTVANFTGSLDEIYIWNRVITSAEISSLYNGGLGHRPEPNGLLTNLIAYYTLDGTANDYFWNNHGIENNITYSAGILNQGAIFNSSNSSAIFLGQIVQASAGTINMWFKPEPSSSVQSLIANGAGDLFIQVLNGVAIQVRYFDVDYKILNASCVANQWQLLTFTWDSNVIKLYINSVLIDQTSALKIGSVANAFALGQNGGAASNNYNGQIDEFGLWGRALSSSEISYLYSNGNARRPYGEDLTHRIISYWNMDGNFIDSVGNNTPSSSSSALYVPGKIGKAAYNGGIGNVKLDYNPTMDSKIISISMWINPVTFTNQSYVFSKLRVGGGGDNAFSVVYGYTSGVAFYAFPMSTPDYQSTTISINVGEWTHITYTYDGRNLKGYKNGVLVIDLTFNLTLSVGTGEAFFYSYDASSHISDVYLDEVGIWSRVLSATEIERLARSGNQYPFQKKVSSFVNNRATVLTDGLTNHWKLDGDSVDYKTGIIGTDTSVVYQPAKIYKGASFNGVSSSVDTNQNVPAFVNTSAFTVSCWVKPTTLTPLAPFVTKWDYNPPLSLGTFSLSQSDGVNDTPGKIFFFICSDINDAGANAVQTTNTISTGVWSHLVAVYDGTQSSNQTRAKIYINGVLQSTTTFGAIPTLTTSGTSTVKFARYGLNSFATFNPTMIDEVMVWNRPLTSTEVSELYSEFSYGLSDRVVLYLPMDGDSNSLVNGHSGITSGVTYGIGKISKSLERTGALTESFMVNDSNDFYFADGDWTISMWTKRSVFGGRQGFFGQSNAGGSNTSISLTCEYTDDNRLWSYFNTGSTNLLSLQSNFSIVDTEWHHIIFRRKNNDIRFFVDGVADTINYDASGVNIIDSSNKLGIGQFGEVTISLKFSGSVDEVGLWRRSLSDNEINRLYRGGSQYPFKNKVFKASLRYEIEVLNWVAQMEVAPSDSYLFNLNTMIRRLKSAGIWDELDRFWIFATEQQEHARIDIKSLNSLTEHNSPIWTANVGYKGDGLTQWLDTNYNASTQGIKYTQTSNSKGVYILEGQANGGNDEGVYDDINGVVSTTAARFDASVAVDFGYAGSSQLNSSVSMFSVTDAKGFTSGSRSGTSINEYKNGVNVMSYSAAVQNLPNGKMFALGRSAVGNGSSLVDAPSNRRQALLYYGSGAINHTTLYNIIQSFASAQRFNV
jgi:hypothetical protein